MNTPRFGEILMFLALMRKKAYGKSIPCFPAPKRWALKCFGGTMSIEEFRSYGGFVEPPVVHWPHEKLHVVTVGSGAAVETKPNGSIGYSKSMGAKRMNDIETSTTETSTLKLKRNKPLQRSDSKLENILGITRKGKETQN